jgi:hypothetical protein
MKRIAAVVAAVFMAATTLGGCGGGGSSNGGGGYCASLKSAQRKLTSGAVGGSVSRKKVASIVRGAADKAPSRLGSDWNLVLKALSHPTGLNPSDATKLRTAATEIAKDAKSHCQVAVNFGD